MLRFPAALLLACLVLRPAPLPAPVAARLAGYADAFAQKARNLTTEETLVQRAYRIPPHPHLAIGAAAGTLYAQYVTHQVVSAYRIGRLKGDASGNLLEFRELVSMDGAPVQTPQVARQALAAEIIGGAGEDRVRKKILGEFTRLGLLDVATDYGTILLAFTTVGQRTLDFEEAGTAWVGTEEADVWNWQQTSGGALEFRGRKTERRVLHGSLWVRKSDGLPLRVSALFAHAEEKHELRDEASVDFVLSGFGCVTPASVVHRHIVDDVVLTENLYTYEPFRMFSTDTNIRYSGVDGKQ